MSQQPDPYRQQSTNDDSEQIQTIAIIAGVSIAIVGILLIALAVILALNADTADAGVEVVRDVLIIALALEFVIIGAAVIVFLIQAARFVNLLMNEISPLIDATSETVNTLRGTAVFLSKNLAEPVVQGNAAVRGIAKVVGDVEAVRKAAGIVSAASSAMSPTGTRSTKNSSIEENAHTTVEQNEDQQNGKEK